MLPSYNEKKAVQLAGHLLKLRGGPMSYLKLLKLMYIVDREALSRWGKSITSDRYVSMKNGPVLSTTYDRINEDSQEQTLWDRHIQTIEHHEVSLIQDAGVSQLSEAECRLIAEVFAEHGKKSRWELRDFTHTFQEWKNPNGSSIPISYSDILTAKGVSPETQAIILGDIDASATLDAILEEFA